MILALLIVAIVIVAFSQSAPGADLPPGDPITPPPEDPFVPPPIGPDPGQGVPGMPPQTPTPPGDPSLPGPSGPGCSPDNPELCIPGAVGGGGGASWLPGDNHDYDNQFLYAPNSDDNTRRIFAGDPRVPLALKAIAWKESGESWSWNPLAHNLTAIEDSRGIMQVNVRAHPQFASWDLYDPNLCILAAAYVFMGTWNAGNLFDSIRAYNGSGQMAVDYATRVFTVLEPMAQAAGITLA